MTEIGDLYGKALYELAAEEGIEEKVYSDLLLISEALRETPEYLRLMDSYSISKQEKAALLDEAFQARIETMSLNVLKLLMERNGFRSFTACQKVFKELYYDAKGIVEAKITSAISLTEAQNAKLVSAVEAKVKKKIVPIFTVDASVRGGIKVEIEGVCYDNTVNTKLEHINRLLRQA